MPNKALYFQTNNQPPWVYLSLYWEWRWLLNLQCLNDVIYRGSYHQNRLWRLSSLSKSALRIIIIHQNRLWVIIIIKIGSEDHLSSKSTGWIIIKIGWKDVGRKHNVGQNKKTKLPLHQWHLKHCCGTAMFLQILPTRAKPTWCGETRLRKQWEVCWG